MFQKNSIGIDEALGALQAMLAEIRDNPKKYWQHACIAIVDEAGKLVAFAKMDSTSQMVQDIAIRKAWTAALWRRDISDANAYVATRDWGMQDFLEGATAIPGGVVIVNPHESDEPPLVNPEKGGRGESWVKPCIGAIGVSAAGPWQRDMEVAYVGLKYIQDKLWPKK